MPLDQERAAFEAALARMPDWAPEFEQHRAWAEKLCWFVWLDAKTHARAALAAAPAQAVLLAWIYEDTLPSEYPYDAMFPHSQVRGGVRMFPVFAPAAPQVPICQACKGSGEGGSYRVPGTESDFVDGPCHSCCGSGEAAPQVPAVPASVRERWNIERDGDALLVCFNDHEKGQGCRYVRFVPDAPQVPAVPDGVAPGYVMTNQRAVFFLERFKREEKLLGPHEQLALKHAIAVLEAPGAPQPAERVPLTVPEIQERFAPLQSPDVTERDWLWFLSGFGNAERAYGIRAAGVKEPANAGITGPRSGSSA